MSETHQYRLIVRRGPQPNQVFELTNNVYSLGRDIVNDITIGDVEVSRQHCQFMRGSEGYTIEDLDSTNGTFINGERLHGSRLLTNGDSIGFGETVVLTYAVTMNVVAKDSSSPTRPIRAVEIDGQPATDVLDEALKDPTNPIAPPKPAQAAYVYTPPPNSEPIPEVRRVVMLGCGLLVTVCLVGLLTTVVLINASNAWADVPVLGGLFDAPPVDMTTAETDAYTIEVPVEWQLGKAQFDDVQMVWLMPDAALWVDAIDLRFADSEGVAIILQEGARDTVMTTMQDAILAANNLTLADEAVMERTIDDRTAREVTLTATNGVTIRVVGVEVGDQTLIFVGVSPTASQRTNTEIFDYMLDTLRFK